MTLSPWQSAAATIGPDAPDDYLLKPTVHAQLYEESAPALSALLRRTAAKIAAEEFERADGIAIDAQRAFKRAAGQANVAALVTSCVSAVVLVAALLGAPGIVLLVFGGSGAVSGAYGAYLLQRVRQQHLLQRWMTGRAEAEEQRHRYFELVCLAEPTTEGPSPSSLQLEYFRRYQLDVQVVYYDSRQRHHQRAADRTVTYAAGAAFVAALSTGLAGFLGAGEGANWAGLAALGILGTSLGTYAAVRDSIGQDARNAERFERTRMALRDISVRLDDVRDAVATGNRAALTEFIAAVHEHLSVEHRQWLSEVDSTRVALERIEEALRGSKDAPAEGAPAATTAAPPGARPDVSGAGGSTALL